MSDHGLAQALRNAEFEAREFDRLKKTGHFRRNAERIAAGRIDPLPRPPKAVFDAPSVAIVDRLEPAEYVAEPNDAGAVSLQPLAEFDDALSRPEEHPGQLRFNAQWAALLEIAKRDTGDCADPARRREAEERRAELLDISLKVAANIEARQVATCLRQDETVIWLQGSHSGIVNAPVRFYSHMLLPIVQAQKRQPYLLAASYFLQSRPHARTAVFTTGPRTKLRDVGERVEDLHRGLSRLNSEIRKRFRIEMVLRSTETGTPEHDEDGDCIDPGSIERDADGEPTFHVHAHVILHHLNDKPLSPDEWQKFLGFVSRRWGFWWRDCGVLRDAAETVKYMFKPRELEKLTGDEQAELFRQLQGKRLLECMGELRGERRSRKERKKRIDRQPTPDGRILREVDDWNAHGPRKPTDALETALEHVCESGGDPFRVKDHERPQRGETWTLDRRVPDPDAKCTAILPPMFMPGSNVRECVFVMVGKRIDPEAYKLDRRCTLIVEETRDEWQAGREAAAAIMVHTCTPTVGTDLPGFEVGRVLEGRPRPR